MATQNSQLIENLNLIYNEKLAQKTVLETTSDDFLMYHTYIAALKPSGYTSILSNGQVDVSSYKYAYVSVDGGGIVPSGSYTITTNGEYDVYNYATAVVEVDSSIPEGYVLPSGNIDLIQNGMVDVKEYAYATVAMPVPTGTVNITENGTAIDVSEYASANVAVPVPSGYVLPSGILEINENVIAAECSSYQYVTVEVEGGGSGSSSDPWYDFIQVYEMIENEETSADYARTTISENFEYVEENGEYTISWDDREEIDTGEVDQNDEPIYEEKTIHVVLTGDPHEIYAEGSNIASALEEYEDLYSCIYPILENATLTESSDPSEDGYDYLLEGDLYAWNLIDDCGQVQQINESGFYIGSGPVGFNVNEPYRESNYHVFNLNNQVIPVAGNTDSIDVAEIQNYNQIICHNGVEVNYVDPTTMEESTNSYYNFELCEQSQNIPISGLLDGSIFNDTVSDIQYFQYTGQNNTYVNYINIYHNVYTEELDPDTGDPIHNWEHSNVSYWGTVHGQHFCELEPGDRIYVTSYEFVAGQHLYPIVYRNGAAIVNNLVDNAMWPYEEE